MILSRYNTNNDNNSAVSKLDVCGVKIRNTFLIFD